VAVPTVAPDPLLTSIVKPIGLPCVTEAASALLVTDSAGQSTGTPDGGEEKLTPPVLVDDTISE
jgi:hypothetical protein